jgi:polyphosphate kinase 2 (PPK2 family)
VRSAICRTPAGEVAGLDRSWYNRAGVERIGFCTEKEAREFR